VHFHTVAIPFEVGQVSTQILVGGVKMYTSVAIPFEVGQVSTPMYFCYMWEKNFVAIPFEVGQVSTHFYKGIESGHIYYLSQSLLK